ncbi:MAG: hypothetical protein WC675_02465 [Patescibacteria group bacterium]|jgi:hypothetical protein
MVDPQLQGIYRFLGLLLAAGLGIGIIVVILERKIDDYNWGKRYERRKKIKAKIDNKFGKK